MKVMLLFVVVVISTALNADEAQTIVALKPSCCSTSAPSPGVFSDTSLYQLDSAWTSANGSTIKLQNLKGRVQVVTMFFARCDFACPILVHDMKRIEAALPPSLRSNVGFVLVSFDTERDTPEALRIYGARMELDTNRWTLLRGSSDDVFELAALLGIKFKKDSRGQFAHSNAITVLNPSGEIVHQQIGLNQDVQPSTSAISVAARHAKVAANEDESTNR